MPHKYESLAEARSGRGVGQGSRVARHPSQCDALGGDESWDVRRWGWWPFGGSHRRGPSDGLSVASENALAEDAAAELAPAGHLSQAHQASRGAQAVGPAHPPGGAGGVPPAAEPWSSVHEKRWMPDEKCTACFHCKVQFSVVRRRHHCRSCGQIFCYNCSCHRVEGHLVGRPKEQLSRVCLDCAKRYEDVTDRQSAQRQPPGTPLETSRPSSGLLEPAVDSFLDPGALPQGDNASIGSDRAADMTGSPSGDEATSSDGGESPRLNPHALSRGHQDEMGETLSFRSGSLLSDTDLDENSRGHYDWYGGLGYSGAAGDGRRRRNEVGIPTAATLAMLQIGREPDVDQPPASERRRNAQTAWRQMTEANVKHFAHSVRERCAQVGRGLEDPMHVLMICELAQKVVEHMHPSKGDHMDIMSYVKVKRIPGGSFDKSDFVDGVVFTGDLAHRKMARNIERCNLALLREPISFDPENRPTSLDQLIRGEAKFIDIKVEKIENALQPRPQLLLCQCGVSQIAQEKLRAKNISLVLGVKPRILEAIARCTGSRVIQSVDMITESSKNTAGSVGTAGRFRVCSSGEAGMEGAKSLVRIEGSCPGKFSTVCLRGFGSKPVDEAMQLLARSKRILQWAIRLARHMQLESELLFEMCCEPWTDRATPALAPASDPDEGSQAEHLDLTVYTVSEKDGWSCKPPVSLRISAYEAAPTSPRSAPAGQRAPQRKGWAGGLDGSPEVIRDCAVHDWLMRCFNSETVGSRTPVASMSDESGALDTAIESFADAQEPEGVLVPRRNEILCLENKQSRIIVQWLNDESLGREERIGVREARIRADSDWDVQRRRVAQTRWSSLSTHEEEGGHEAEGASWRGEGGPAAKAKFEVTVRQLCEVAKDDWKAVTPRNMLTASAMSHSLAKFFDMIFNNRDSQSSRSSLGCSPSKAAERCCSHAAFREHILLFSCPGRHHILSVYYEPITLWRLAPAHLPCRELASRCPAGLDAGLYAREESQLTSKIEEIQALVNTISEVVNAILAALRVTMQGDATSDDDRPERAITSEQGLEQTEPPVAAVRGLPESLAVSLRENRTAWYRELQQLARMEKCIRDQLKVAQDALGNGDPVIVAAGKRDLLDALRRGAALTDSVLRGSSHTPRAVPSEAAKGTLAPILKGFSDTLKRLWPSDGADAARAEPTSPPSSLDLSVDTSLKRSFSQEHVPAAHGVAEGALDGAAKGWGMARSRSESFLLSGMAARTPLRMRRTISIDSTCQDKAREGKSMPQRLEELQAKLGELGPGKEEGLFASAALPRGVQGLCLPVQEEDVGSVVAYALLSCQAHKQMQEQWKTLPGGAPRCPLAERARGSAACGCGQGHEWSCYASMPASLCPPCSAAGSSAPSPCPAGPPEGAAASSSSPPPLAAQALLPSALLEGACGPAAALSPTAPADGPGASCPAAATRAQTSAGVERRAGLERLSWKRPGGQAPRHPGWAQGSQEARSVLTSQIGEPIRVEFGDKECKYCVDIHHPLQYHIVRHCLCGDDLNFARSLYYCQRIKTSGGKSGSLFFISHDRRFLLKQINTAEFKMLQKSEKRSHVEALFWYADKVLFEGLPSVLVQVVGLFTVTLQRPKKAARVLHFIVQRNLRQGLMSTPTCVFDLKGVGKSRKMETARGREDERDDDQGPASAGSGALGGNAEARAEPLDDGRKEESKQVLWDQNFREYCRGRPLCLEPSDLKHLEAAVWNDAQLLCHLSLVDYSLLLVVAEPQDGRSPGALSLGIIDYLRPYTWDKQVETVVKRQWKDPTIVDPAEYKARFQGAMMTFFVASSGT